MQFGVDCKTLYEIRTLSLSLCARTRVLQTCALASRLHRLGHVHRVLLPLSLLHSLSSSPLLSFPFLSSPILSSPFPPLSISFVSRRYGAPGIVGTDSAYTDNGYVYHTPSDTLSAIPDRSSLLPSPLSPLPSPHTSTTRTLCRSTGPFTTQAPICYLF